jgi:apolipoprotein N-acyltransferase
LGFAAASGAALALAYPDYHIWLLGWVALGGLIFCSLGAPVRQASVCGLLFGLVHYTISLPWIYTVLRVYGPVPKWEAAGLLLLLSLAASVFCAAFAALVAWLSNRSERLAMLAAPFLWVALEFLRTHLPDIGFPWNLLGYVASNSLGLLQIASVTGIFGLSLLVATYNTLFLWAFLSIGRVKARPLSSPPVLSWMGATVTLAGFAFIGSLMIPTSKPTLIAHLVQTNLPQSTSYQPDWDVVHAGDMEQLERMTAEAGRARPGLVVWPEVPAPFSLQEGAFAERATRIARESESDFLLGIVHWKSLDSRMQAFNSAALLNSKGQQTFVYDKIHLVPFSEYIPWRKGLWFATELTALISDFSNGADYSVGSLPEGRFSVLICYEAIFPDQVRRYVNNGADLLINISNDGWFGNSSALSQHLEMARVRAVENRRWLLRDTNTGETVSVDPYGRIIARLPRYSRGVLDAPYGLRDDRTFYTRWGDWVPWLSTGIALSLVAAGAFVKKREANAGKEANQY